MEQNLKLLNQLEKDMDFLNKNMEFFKKEYDQKFIAIKDENVVAVGRLIEDVINTLKLQNIDSSETIIQFISKMKVIL